MVINHDHLWILVELIENYLDLKEKFKVFKGSFEWNEEMSKENVGKQIVFFSLFVISTNFWYFCNFFKWFFLKTTKILITNLWKPPLKIS